MRKIIPTPKAFCDNLDNAFLTAVSDTQQLLKNIAIIFVEAVVLVLIILEAQSIGIGIS